VWVTWREAIDKALYGEAGFYIHQRPLRHYRTSVGVSPIFAEAVLRLLADVDARLGHPDPLDFVDVGAGDGTLAAGVLSFASPDLAERLRVTAVELAPRPEGPRRGSPGRPPRRTGCAASSSPTSGSTTSPSTWPSRPTEAPGWSWSTRVPAPSASVPSPTRRTSPGSPAGGR
jgi:hypothetical protein